ncbi:glycosyltransferase family 2 protein [Pararhizobium mangrovi]|uniref:Glycosyltransferase family 2 protein n=1 Tax=Pararhizobium mangrovi TaxID=2590452 RepID=A0A506U280_9HYPH|nr:glycosyltransferase [Pararhizobium mangrovi]TPW25977.1 glycosyltransferase family 2 protein [Pararhizobium mangrovi]
MRSHKLSTGQAVYLLPFSILEDADIELKQVPTWNSGTKRFAFPSKRPHSTHTIGFVGSEDLYRAIEPECDIRLLTPTNWRLWLNDIDVVLIEPCLLDVTRAWKGCSFDSGTQSDALRDLLNAARKANVYTAAWITSDVNYWDLHSNFAYLCDATFCADYEFSNRLADVNRCAFHLPQLIQPSLHNPFIDLADRSISTPRIIFLRLTSVLSERSLAQNLSPLCSRGLGIVEVKGHVRRERAYSIPHLRDSVLGYAGFRDRLILLKKAQILIQAEEDPITRHTGERDALEAAACQCVVIYRGKLAAEDARSGFAKVFASWGELLEFVDFLLADRVSFLREAQKSWRIAQEHYNISIALQKILQKSSVSLNSPQKRVTVVTPTYRSSRLSQVLKQFRAQTWAEKELIIVANAGGSDEWDIDQIRGEFGEQIIVLPRECWAATALNVGASRSSGDYIVRMDDDDYYGENYIKDMMLSARCSGADVLGKQGEFVYSQADDCIYRRGKRSFHPTVFLSSEFSYQQTPMTGFCMMMRRDVAVRYGYPDLDYSWADSGFLYRYSEKAELTMAVVDNLNAIVERRTDLLTHTRQRPDNWSDAQVERLENSIADFMV